MVIMDNMDDMDNMGIYIYLCYIYTHMVDIARWATKPPLNGFAGAARCASPSPAWGWGHQAVRWVFSWGKWWFFHGENGDFHGKNMEKWLGESFVDEIYDQLEEFWSWPAEKHVFKGCFEHTDMWDFGHFFRITAEMWWNLTNVFHQICG